MKRARSFKEDDQVFAKIKGYPPWPAKVSPNPIDWIFALHDTVL